MNQKKAEAHRKFTFPLMKAKLGQMISKDPLGAILLTKLSFRSKLNYSVKPILSCQRQDKDRPWFFLVAIQSALSGHGTPV